MDTCSTTDGDEEGRIDIDEEGRIAPMFCIEEAPRAERTHTKYDVGFVCYLVSCNELTKIERHVRASLLRSTCVWILPGGEKGSAKAPN